MDMKYLESCLSESRWKDIACNGNFKGVKFDLVARRKLGWGHEMFNFLVRIVPSLDLKKSMLLQSQYDICYREVKKPFSKESFCMCIVAEDIPGETRLLMKEGRLLTGIGNGLVIFDAENGMWYGIKKVDDKFTFVSQAYYRDKQK